MRDWENGLSLQSRDRLSLAALSLAVNLSLLWFQGVRTGADSVRYLSGAANLLSSQGVSPLDSGYIGYVAVVAAFRGLGLGLEAIVLLQIATAALATVALYELGRNLAGRVAGIAAALFFCFNPDIARWHSYVLTDSLYGSGLVLAVWALYGVSAATGLGALRAVALVAATALLRPTGFVLATVLLAYGMFATVRDRRWRVLGLVALLGASASAPVAAPSLRAVLERVAPADLLRQGVVVWGSDWHPLPLLLPADAERLGAVEIMTGHPFATFWLGVNRIVAALLHVRPFYSLRHNVGIVVELVVLYSLAAVGFWVCRREAVARLIGALIGAHLMIIAFVCADWDGRYLVHLLPIMGVMSGVGAARVLGAIAPGAWASLGGKKPEEGSEIPPSP